MKGLQITLGAIVLVVLSACSNYESFSKRKYTRGIFRTKSEKRHGQEAKKVEDDKSDVTLQFASLPEQESVGVDHKNEVQKNHAVDLEFEATEIDIPNDVTSAVSDENQKKEIDAAAPPKRVEKSQPSEKRRTKKKQLTIEEKNARATLVLGIIGVSLITLVMMLMPVMHVSATLVAFYGILRLSALFGLLGIYKGTTFYKNPIEGKYDKFRRRGLFLSVLATVMWLVFLIL